MFRRAVASARLSARSLSSDAHAAPQYEGLEAVVRGYLPHNHQVRGLGREGGGDCRARWGVDVRGAARMCKAWGRVPFPPASF